MLSSNKFFDDFSQKSKCFAFNKSFFHARSVTGSEMRVLKCLCRFKMCTDFKDSVFVKSLALKHIGVWESYFILRNFSLNFILG